MDRLTSSILSPMIRYLIHKGLVSLSVRDWSLITGRGGYKTGGGGT